MVKTAIFISGNVPRPFLVEIGTITAMSNFIYILAKSSPSALVDAFRGL